MKRYHIVFVLLIFILSSCREKESTIKVQNLLPKASIRNVEWGGIPISSRILPGQTSREIRLFEKNSYYDIELPATFPLKYYIEVNGDMVYVQTKNSYRLDTEQDLIITISDTTKVFNPLLETSSTMNEILKRIQAIK